VQFPRNACTFLDAVFEALLETLLESLIQVSDTQQMREREHADRKSDVEKIEHLGVTRRLIKLAMRNITK
jgi:hypothetical protein